MIPQDVTAVSRPNLPAPSQISQSELERLAQLQMNRREFNRLRQSVLQRLTAGASIEHGRYHVSVEQKHSRRFGRHALEQLWGVEYVQQLQASLPESVSQHLRVTDQLPIAEL